MHGHSGWAGDVDKGMNPPGTIVSAPTLTDKDREDLRFGAAQGVDNIALSFVRGAEDIIAAKQVIADSRRKRARDRQNRTAGGRHGVGSHPRPCGRRHGGARGFGQELGPEAVPVPAEAHHRRRQSPSPIG